MNNTKTRNIIIGALVVVVALILIFFGRNKNTKTTEQPAEENTTDNTATTAAVPVEIPIPKEESFVTKNIKNEISLDVPNNYYISYPRIDGCDSVISIGTQTAKVPVISIMLVYKNGCVTNSDVVSGAKKLVEKNGYIFQTNSMSPSVLAVFDRIVSSAK